MLFKEKEREIYTEISIRDMAIWCYDTNRTFKVSSTLQDYLQAKGFVGCIKQFGNNALLVLDRQGTAVKMFAKSDYVSLLQYLELQANTIDINFKGYSAKAFIPPKGGKKLNNNQVVKA